jgi:hypothetical protein
VYVGVVLQSRQLTEHSCIAVSFRVGWHLGVMSARRGRIGATFWNAGAWRIVRTIKASESQKPVDPSCSQFPFPSIYIRKVVACKPVQNRDCVLLCSCEIVVCSLSSPTTRRR